MHIYSTYQWNDKLNNSLDATTCYKHENKCRSWITLRLVSTISCPWNPYQILLDWQAAIVTYNGFQNSTTWASRSSFSNIGHDFARQVRYPIPSNDWKHYFPTSKWNFLGQQLSPSVDLVNLSAPLQFWTAFELGSMLLGIATNHFLGRLKSTWSLHEQQIGYFTDPETLSSAQLGAGTSRKWHLLWTSAGSRCGWTGRVWSKSMVQVLVKIRIE